MESVAEGLALSESVGGEEGVPVGEREAVGQALEHAVGAALEGDEEGVRDNEAVAQGDADLLPATPLPAANLREGEGVPVLLCEGLLVTLGLRVGVEGAEFEGDSLGDPLGVALWEALGEKVVDAQSVVEGERVSSLGVPVGEGEVERDREAPPVVVAVPLGSVGELVALALRESEGVALGDGVALIEVVCEELREGEREGHGVLEVLGDTVPLMLTLRPPLLVARGAVAVALGRGGAVLLTVELRVAFLAREGVKSSVGFMVTTGLGETLGEGLPEKLPEAVRVGVEVGEPLRAEERVLVTWVDPEGQGDVEGLGVRVTAAVGEGVALGLSEGGAFVAEGEREGVEQGVSLAEALGLREGEREPEPLLPREGDRAGVPEGAKDAVREALAVGDGGALAGAVEDTVGVAAGVVLGERLALGDFVGVGLELPLRLTLGVCDEVALAVEHGVGGGVARGVVVAVGRSRVPEGEGRWAVVAVAPSVPLEGGEGVLCSVGSELARGEGEPPKEVLGDGVEVKEGGGLALVVGHLEEDTLSVGEGEVEGLVEGLCVALGEREGMGLVVDFPLREGLLEGLLEVLGEREWLGEAVRVALARALREALGEREEVWLRAPLGVVVLEKEGEGEALGEREEVGEREGEREAAGEALGEEEEEGHFEVRGVGDEEDVLAPSLPPTPPRPPGEAVKVLDPPRGVRVVLREGVGWEEAPALLLVEGERDKEGEAQGEGVGGGLRVAQAEVEGEGEALGEARGEALPAALRVGEGEKEGEGEALGVRCEDWEGRVLPG